MASFWFTPAITKILQQSIDIDNDTLKCMLIGNAGNWTPDKDNEFVDEGGSNDALADELVATNYTGGFGGGGRMVLSTTITEDLANDRVVVIFPDTTWTSLGGATNDTITAAVLIKEVTNDADSPLIAYWDVTDTTTNGGDVTLDFDGTNGNLRLNN